jgi:hypothetical protein
MQPFDSDFADDALHVFYELPTNDFNALVSDLETISRDVPKDLPLGVHPLLVQQGTTGQFASALKQALFLRIGASRLVRVTAMQMTQNAGAWSFRGFDFVQGASPTPIGILGTSTTAQAVQGFAGISPPTPVFPEDSPFSLLWSSAQSSQATTAQRQAAYDAALMIENPKLKTVEEVSCVACHTALPARLGAESAFSLSANGNPNRFVSSFNLALTSLPETQTPLNSMHAFGYRSTAVSISQRTVNDSAAVAAFLNSRSQ